MATPELTYCSLLSLFILFTLSCQGFEAERMIRSPGAALDPLGVTYSVAYALIYLSESLRF